MRTLRTFLFLLACLAIPHAAHAGLFKNLVDLFTGTGISQDGGLAQETEPPVPPPEQLLDIGVNSTQLLDIGVNSTQLLRLN